MKSFTSFLDFKSSELQALVTRAREIKRGSPAQGIAGKTLGMLFFNPSLRTRVSFEAAMLKFGGHAISLSAGGDVWSLETKEGAVMNSNKTEHIKDAARVLSRYCDALALRTFAGLTDLQSDLHEAVLGAFKKYASVPVISMESSMEHPCQALADMTTMKEKIGDKKATFTLTWAPHIKSIPMAVPNSALLAAANLGLEITIAHPPGFDLPDQFVSHAKERANSLGGSVRITHDQDEACRNADIVYAKNWSPACYYNDTEKLIEEVTRHSTWKVSQSKLKTEALFLHCLPVRRNVEVSDDVLDGPSSGVYDQAENRLWAQAAVLEKIFIE